MLVPSKMQSPLLVCHSTNVVGQMFSKRVMCRNSQPILNRLDVSKTQQVVRIWVVMRYLLSLTKEGLFLFLAAQR